MHTSFNICNMLTAIATLEWQHLAGKMTPWFSFFKQSYIFLLFNYYCLWTLMSITIIQLKILNTIEICLST